MGQSLSCVKEQGEQVQLRLVFPQELNTLGLRLIVIDRFLAFVLVLNLVIVPTLEALVHLSHRRLTLLRGELYEQLVAVIQRDFAPHGIELLFQNLLVHTMSHRVLTQLVLFFQVIVDKAVCCTLEGVVCSVRPHRVFCSIHREEHVCNVFNVERTLGLVTFACCFRCHSKRIVNVRFHGIDEVELHDLEPAHGGADVILHQKFALGVIDDHVVRALLTHPNIEHRLNVRLTLTSTSHSKDHGVGRGRIDVIHARWTLRLIRRQFPLPVHEVSKRGKAFELISARVPRVVGNSARVETPTQLIVIRQARRVPQSRSKGFIEHRNQVGDRGSVFIGENLALEQSHIAIVIEHVLLSTLGKGHRLNTLIRHHRV